MPTTCAASRFTTGATAAIVAVALIAPAAAQVYKCVDKSGHTTYQQSPCTGGQQGGTVKLEESVTVRPAGGEAMWSAAAREQRVVVGMPKPFVTEALGTPAEIRAPRSGESGTEVWVYTKSGQTTRLGFVNNALAWMRTDSAAKESRAQAPPAASGASSGSDREARIREALAVGKTCAAALQDAGTPDREEPLSAGTTTGARYVYQLDAANPNAFAAFVCLNGRVTSVERYVPGTR
jgi:Domain of unknown function (DUF4124)